MFTVETINYTRFLLLSERHGNADKTVKDKKKIKSELVHAILKRAGFRNIKVQTATKTNSISNISTSHSITIRNSNY